MCILTGCEKLVKFAEKSDFHSQIQELCKFGRQEKAATDTSYATFLVAQNCTTSFGFVQLDVVQYSALKDLESMQYVVVWVLTYTWESYDPLLDAIAPTY